MSPAGVSPSAPDVHGAMAAITARMAEVTTRFSPPGPSGPTFGDSLVKASGTSRPVGSSATPQRVGTLPAGAGWGGSSAASGDNVVELAQRFLGVPYVWGGEDPSGFDCSGLVQYVYRQVGLELPRVSHQQARVGTPVADLSQARPGDILAFDAPVDHVALYVGDGRMIAAPKRGDVVKVQPVYERPTAIRRLLPTEAAAPLASALAGLLGPRLVGTPAETVPTASAGADPAPAAGLDVAALLALATADRAALLAPREGIS